MVNFSNTDYENIELALDCLQSAEDSLTCFAMHLGKVKQLSRTTDEAKASIGDLRVARKILMIELGGLRDAGRDNLESEGDNE